MPEHPRMLYRDLRLIPTLVSLIALGILGLAYRDLDARFRNYSVGGTLVYVLGSAAIAYFHTTWAARQGGVLAENWQFFLIVGLHGAWFLGLIAFFIWRGVI